MRVLLFKVANWVMEAMLERDVEEAARLGTREEIGESSTWEEVRPGKSLPVYAPLIIRSSSVSPSRGASRDLERILFPKTMARCSLLSMLFWYKWRNISVPVVLWRMICQRFFRKRRIVRSDDYVGILALTIQLTLGSSSISFGGFLLATGPMSGVLGVVGGVNAGLRMEGGTCPSGPRSIAESERDMGFIARSVGEA